MTNGLGGARVALLEARMSGELAGLVRRHGGEPVSVPAVREAARVCPAAVATVLDELARGAGRVVIFLTGAGVDALAQAAERLGRREELVVALRAAVTVCRGPKPMAALQRLGVPVSLPTRAPYTTAELLEALADLELAGRGVTLIHYGERNEALAGALHERAARLTELCLYEWLLPEDTTALQTLIDDLAAGTIAAIAFTSQVQVRHLYRVAAATGRAATLTRALQSQVVVASIGPTCTAALEQVGVTPRVVPAHPKMGHLVLALARHLQPALARERAGAVASAAMPAGAHVGPR